MGGRLEKVAVVGSGEAIEELVAEDKYLKVNGWTGVMAEPESSQSRFDSE